MSDTKVFKIKYYPYPYTRPREFTEYSGEYVGENPNILALRVKWGLFSYVKEFDKYKISSISKS